MQYQVEIASTGEVLGVFQGGSDVEAVNNAMIEAGYTSLEEACDLGVDGQDITAYPIAEWKS